MEKKWKVSLSYEVNRMAKMNLSDTYEKLLPKRQYKISNNKESKVINKPCGSLTKSRGYSR